MVNLTIDSHGKPRATSRSVTPTQEELGSPEGAPPTPACAGARPSPRRACAHARASIPDVRAGASASALCIPYPAPKSARGRAHPVRASPHADARAPPPPTPVWLPPSLPVDMRTPPLARGRQRREPRGGAGRLVRRPPWVTVTQHPQWRASPEPKRLVTSHGVAPSHLTSLGLLQLLRQETHTHSLSLCLHLYLVSPWSPGPAWPCPAAPI